MKTLGLTGGIASGKSTVASLFVQGGIPVVDADQVARDVVAPGSDGLAEVVACFGAQVLHPDGALDRKELGAVVMEDAEARQALEAITHPRIFHGITDALDRLEREGHAVAAVEAALMIETGSYRMYDTVVVVAASSDIQRARLMAREHMDEATADKWLAAQLPLEEKIKHADVVLWNNGSLEELEAATAAALADLSR